MTEFNSNKYSVGWYKLAEFVVKKEKEKALGILRLLVHSLNDSAFASQLEGDLLSSFQDPKAIDCYVKAAQLFEKSSKTIEAVSVYEHLLTISPETVEYLQKLLALYQILGNENKILASWVSLLDILVKKNMRNEVDELCSQSNTIFSDPLIVHQYVVMSFLRYGEVYGGHEGYGGFDRHILNYHIERAIRYFINLDETSLNQFIARLSALDAQSYTFACDVIKKKDYKKKAA